MPPESRDPAYLWDMIDAARSIQRITAGVSFEQYMKNEVLQLAIQRQLEVVGEAARRVSEPFKKAHPEIPWKEIIGLRNILVHEYGDIRPDRIWSVVTDNVPSLVASLETLIPPLPED